MKFLRYLVGFPVAVIVTSLLFLLMYHLIRDDGSTVPDALEDIRETVLPKRTPPPPPPDPTPPPDLPPPPKPENNGDGDPIPGPKIKDPRPDPGKIPGLPGNPGGMEGPTITPTGFYPVLQKLPAYPANCAAREIEGDVTVEYDVTNGGQVINARVVESDDSCLDKVALRAIEGWKYSPLPDADPDGIRKRGLQKTFDFKLEE